MWIQKDKYKPKDDLFWSRIGSEIRGGGLQRNISGGGEWEAVDGWGGGRQLGH